MDFNKVFNECLPNSDGIRYILRVSDESGTYIYTCETMAEVCSILVRILLFVLEFDIDNYQYHDRGDSEYDAYEELYDKLVNMLRHKKFNYHEIKKYFGDKFDSRIPDGLWYNSPLGVDFTLIDYENETMEFCVNGDSLWK